MNVPRVQVFCDESRLTVLVDKKSYGVTLTGEEIQLGDGCYSNGERPNQFVFTYGVDECGTAQEMLNGLKMFTNTLHLNLKKPPPNWWQTPSTVHVSCFPKRSYDNPGFFDSMAPSESGKGFNIKAMNPSWTSAADSNVYTRGQVVNLQVSAKTRPDQQLFIQSCFVSSSPEPQTKPRHAVILNRGCTAPLGSLHPVVQFVASGRGDVVHLALNTSYLISEWLNKHFISDAKAIVSTGPLVIVDKDTEMSAVSEPHQTTSAPVPDPMVSGAAVTEDTIMSGASVSSKFSSPPKGVVVLSQDPAARLTLWLPGEVRDIGPESEDSWTVQLKASNAVSNDLPVPQPSTTDKESHELNQIDLKQMGDELAQMQADAAVMPQEETNDVQPVIRTKVQFAKGVDGSHTLSYEEEVVKQQEGEGVIRTYGTGWVKKKEPRQRGLRSIFLDLLRMMDKAE
ncbi:zona pellucida sperm-binding protein 3-like protein [Lates japonicus]|uniref:Zona pellucida sperm-binding protein 3-like protein n=1 Tax=Lates japonicus TaxID=270547 RepID=A0AAD3R5Z5_LATJO|nr:zona pellucida sperm-binding protein 3-like protein [Lates japonicus]